MAQFKRLEEGSVKSFVDKYGVYMELDKYDRKVYESTKEYIRKFKYYKSSNILIGVHHTSLPDGEVLLDNRIKFTGDGRIKSFRFGKDEIRKKYDSNGRLIYYKDPTGFECRWIYQGTKIISELISKGIYQNGSV